MKHTLPITIVIAITIGTSLTGCASDEERARAVLEANASGILACDELYAQSGAALEATLDSMKKGEWSAAQQQLDTLAQPATAAYVECMNREKANLANKLKEAGIPDATAARVSEAWWQEKLQELDAARKTRK